MGIGKKRWKKITPNREKLKQARNAIYCIVYEVKKECWQNFLQGIEKSSDSSQI